MNALEDLLLRCLESRPNAVGYTLSTGLRALYPDLTVFESQSQAFNLEGFAAAGFCTVQEDTSPVSRRSADWNQFEGATVTYPLLSLFSVEWASARLQVLQVNWQDHMSQPRHFFLLAESIQLATAFHDAVCEWATREPEQAIVVLDANGWRHDEAMRADIRGSTLDNLILAGDLKETIVRDLRSFFEARETYLQYGVPWKRGVLLVGPAGNGKTHTIKALINALDVRCVYVKTFVGGGHDHNGIRSVFDNARRMAPCLVVLEDLDSMITPQNRSYFLNELDGFAGNDGLLVVATTNHPDRLDPAIVDRPSRFDRKYPFDLPGPGERLRYIHQWNATLRPALRISAPTAELIAAQTDGFSFAYLKELFLSAMMRWIAEPDPGSMDRVLPEQVETLRSQMASMADLPADPDFAVSAVHTVHTYSTGMVQGGPPQYRGPHMSEGPNVPFGRRPPMQ